MLISVFIQHVVSVCPNSELSQGRSYDQSPLISDIKDCSFTRFNYYSGGPGGVICFNNVIANMSITNSVFFNCLVSNHVWQWGGAVFFNCTEGESYLKMV